ncbi:MAG: caspase family protein, partial [Desulfobacteraceae bacterium]|nr:caspase family protein [Desulfobacteraceae bacterium]
GACDQGSPKPLHECESRNAFQDALASTIKNWTSNDQIIFYYSGHGDEISGEFCFKFGGDLLPFKSLMADLKVHKVIKAVLIIDACHAGAAIGIKGEGDILKSVEELEYPRGIAIITSSTGSEESRELPSGSASVFTDLFCKGIQDGLDKPTEDRLISVGDIVEYINTHLKTDEDYKQYRQHSVFSVHGADRKIWLAKNRRISEKEHALFRTWQTVRSQEELRILYERTVPTKHPCFDAKIEDLNWKLVQQFAEATNPGLIRKKSREEVLEELRLFSAIRHDDERFLHKSAVLCFCRWPFLLYPQAKSVFVWGKSSDGTFMTKDIKGPLSEQFTKLVREVMARLNKISVISEDGFRRNVHEIDRDVVRELISNAIIHRDYEMSGTVQVKITPEALEVQNPGSFPPHMSWDVLMKRQHTSNPVDPTIALYLGSLSAKPFEGIGRGFEVFKKYIKENGRDSISYEELPGPTARVRVSRRTPEDVKRVVVFKSFLKYVTETFVAIVTFAMFVGISIGAHWLYTVWPGISIMIMVKVVAWVISVLGGLCCIALVVRSTIIFIKFLLKGPLQKTSDEKL